MEPQTTAWGNRHAIRTLLAAALALVVWVALAGGAEAHLDLGASADPKRSTANSTEGAKARSGSGRHTEPRREVAKVRNAAGEPVAVADATCEANMAIAAKQGLLLPEGWSLHCVGPGLDWSGGSHWGVTCRYDECPEGAGPYISISNPSYYVVAHELCHANFGDDELMADRCAAKHGASLDASPYS